MGRLARSAALRLARRAERVLWRWRRRRLLALLHWQAARRDATVEAVIAADVRLGPRIAVDILRGSASRVLIGADCELQNDVRLHLRGGTVELCDDVEIRSYGLLSAAGHLRIDSGSKLSWYAAVHCAESVQLARRVGFSERVTVTDSFHFHDGPADFFYHNVESAPVAIGENTWLASNAIVASGVTVGRDCVVGGNAVVTEDVPDATMVAGAPARPVRRTRPGLPPVQRQQVAS